MSIEVDFARCDPCYSEGETVTGNVIVKTNCEFKFNCVNATLFGTVALIDDPEFFPIINYSFQILKSNDSLNKFGNNSQIPFSFTLKSLHPNSTPLLETYYGSKIKIQYFLRFEIKKAGVISQSITKSLEIFIHQTVKDPLPPQKFSFLITPESIARSSSITSIYNLKDEMSIPNCRIYGTIDNTTNPLNKPIRGFIRIDQCEEEIRSLEVRLMRAEFIPEGRKYTDNLFKDTSEIQNLQICDGDIIKDLEVPIHMFLPRNFSCSSLKIDEVPFQIGFELHIIIVFKNNYVILEKIPLKLWRSK